MLIWKQKIRKIDIINLMVGKGVFELNLLNMANAEKCICLKGLK